MVMEVHYFTFGQTHQHPETSDLMKDYWIEIAADTPVKARKKMVEMFGSKWGLQYHEKAFMKYKHHFPKGCYAHFELD